MNQPPTDYQLKARIKYLQERITTLEQTNQQLQDAIRLHKIQNLNQQPRHHDKQLWDQLK